MIAFTYLFGRKNVFTASKGSAFYILFAITAACLVPCGGPKKSPSTSSIVQILLFSFGPLRSDSKNIQNIKKLYV